eukprot:50063_1
MNKILCNHGTTEVVDAHSNEGDIIYKLYLINHQNDTTKNHIKYLFCQNCWFDLLAYLPQLLKYINEASNLSVMNKKQCIKYLKTKASLSHVIFFNEMIGYPFIMQYIFQNQFLYPSVFDCYLNFLQIISATYSTYGDNRLTKQFLLDLDIAKSCIFWHKKHIDYLLKRKFKTLITEKIVHNFIMLQSDDQIVGAMKMLSLVTAFDYSSKIKLLHNELEKRKFIVKMMQCALPSLNINQGNIDTFMEHMCSDKHKQLQFPVGAPNLWILLNLIYYEKKTNKNNEKWIEVVSEYKLHHKLMKVCFNPKCNKGKYKKKKNAEMKSNTYTEKLKSLNRRPEWYKCNGCLIAGYCSKKCQKIHWNKYNHGSQCYLSLS